MLKADSALSTRRSITGGKFTRMDSLAAVAAHKAPFGIIKTFFLFAPLVIVPLGLELGAVVAPVRFAWTLNWARVLQPASAVMVVAAFCLPPGLRAGALTLPWLVVCFLVALGGLSSLPKDSRSLGAIAVNISRVDLLVAGTWLLLSRLGIQPLGFREPIAYSPPCTSTTRGLPPRCLPDPCSNSRGVMIAIPAPVQPLWVSSSLCPSYSPPVSYFHLH